MDRALGDVVPWACVICTWTLLVCGILAHDAVHRGAEAFRVRQLAVVEPIRLLIQVAEQVERFYGNVRPLIARFRSDQ
jgi:hypothetical protein